MTDVENFKNQIEKIGPDNIACILTTTSCFAPKAVDDIEAIGKLCSEYSIYHLVNNAYGLQSSVCAERIDQAAIKANSRVDFVVQSCDKNFLVPVGGAVIASFDLEMINLAKNMYSGNDDAFNI